VSPLGRIRRCSLALGLAVMAAACGGAPSGSAAPAPSGAIAVEAKEYKFTPSAITVPAGDVRFWVRNGGTVEHEFEIFKGESVVSEIEGLVPGLAKELTVELAAGEYTFMCKLNGHDQLGMKGTITVTGS
jgi:iron uptake system component EfeO